MSHSEPGGVGTTTTVTGPDPETTVVTHSSAGGIGSWRIRRAFMFIVTAFCMAVVGYVLYTNRSGAVADNAVTMSFITIISIVGSYVFGGTWDDKNKLDALLPKPAVAVPRPQAAGTTTTTVVTPAPRPSAPGAG